MVQGTASGQLHQAAAVGVAETDRVGMLRWSEDHTGVGGGGWEKVESRATCRYLVGAAAERVGGASQEDTRNKRLGVGGGEESQFAAC